MIILDEESWAKNLLTNGSAKPYPILKDVTILAKYWKYNGLGTHETRLKLEEYCKETDKYWNPVFSYWKIEKSLTSAKNYRLRTMFPVVITKAEVSTIEQFEDYGEQRVLFVLLVYAKFLKYINTRINPTQKTRVIGEFYVNEKMSNMVRVAKVSMRRKERKDFFNRLHDKGLFDYTHNDSLLIKYVDENSDPEIIVDDLSDITLYWARYCGEKVAACSKCGKLFLQRTNMQQKCRHCWKEDKKEKVRLIVTKNYYDKKDNSNHL